MSYDIFDVRGTGGVSYVHCVAADLPDDWETVVDWPRTSANPEEAWCLRTTVIVRY